MDFTVRCQRVCFKIVYRGKNLLLLLLYVCEGCTWFELAIQRRGLDGSRVDWRNFNIPRYER